VTAHARIPTIDSEVFGRFLDVLLRSGGCAVALVEAYLDESGSDAGSPVLCIAGYIVEKTRAINLDREWREVLAWKNLPYFHMVDCAHGNGPFANLSKPERIQVQARMIAAIKRNTFQGIAATISTSDFDEILKGHPLYPDPYVVLAHVVLSGVSKWAEANGPYAEKMAYFFEAGHVSRGYAEAVMNKIFTMPTTRAQYRYGGHAFVEKVSTPAVQAADLLAWQWLKDRKRAYEGIGRPRRKDLESLLSHPHQTAHVPREMLEDVAKLSVPLMRHLIETLGPALEQPS
jgi:hypothetical protein